jgi:hypothetical protein
MDSDTHPTRQMAVNTLARHGPSEHERCNLPRMPALIPPSLAQTGAAPEASCSEPLKMHRQVGLSALVGTLSLRAIRSQCNS